MILIFSYTCTVHRLFGGKFKTIMVLVIVCKTDNKSGYPLLYIMKFNLAAFETCFTHTPSNRNFYFPLDILISTLQGTDESPFFHRNIWHWWAISLTSKTKKGKKIISILYIDYRSPSVITWISIAASLIPSKWYHLETQSAVAIPNFLDILYILIVQRFFHQISH